MKKYQLILVSITASLLCFLSGAINWTFQFIFVGLIYFILGAFISIRNLKLWQGIVLLIPFPLVYDIVWILFGVLSALPIAIIPIIACIIGYMSNIKKSNKSAYLNIIEALLLFLLLSIPFMLNWFSYVINKNAYNRYKFPNIRLYYNNGSKFDNTNFIGKITILDLWHKSCGLCFKQFPKVENFYRSIDTNNIKLYAVNVPINDTMNERKVLDNMNYTFVKLSSGSTFLTCKKQLRIQAVPTIIIIDPEGYVFYEGSFEDDWFILINNINGIIKRIKKKYDNQ